VKQEQSKQEAFYRGQSFWLDTVPGSLQPRTPLSTDTRCDVAIIGAGYTGLWTAWYLKKHAPDLDIVIVEAEIAGFGASGRNGGWCSASICGLEKQMDDPATRSEAIALQRLMIDTVTEVGSVCAAESIDCHFAHDGHTSAAVLPAQLERAHEYVAHMHALGFEDDYRQLNRNELLEWCQVEGALGGYHMPHCAAIHPARLARGLADAVERQGVRIYENSPAAAYDNKGIATPGGRVDAGTVILAAEGYSGSLPDLSRKLVPFHSIMVATDPLTDQQIEATGLTRRFTWNNGRHMVTYGQLTADRRIAFGHRGRYLFNGGIQRNFEPSDPVFSMIKEELLRIFPVLKGINITHTWGGVMGVSRTMTPAVCLNPKTRLGWAGGYFGEGVGATNLAGRTMADLVLGRDTERSHALWVNPDKEKALNQRLWEPEPIRWLGVQARSKWMVWTDRAEAKESRHAGMMNWAMKNIFP
jgi:glycine/D-amino acid oxidase-like deaminating enzyme